MKTKKDNKSIFDIYGKDILRNIQKNGLGLVPVIEHAYRRVRRGEYYISNGVFYLAGQKTFEEYYVYTKSKQTKRTDINIIKKIKK